MRSEAVASRRPELAGPVVFHRTKLGGTAGATAPGSAQTELFPAGLVATVQSRDIDDLSAAAVGWNRECTQLRAGRFFGKISVAHTANMQMGRVSWNTAVQARGRAPAGTRAIAVPIGSDPAPSFYGAVVGAKEIVTEQEGTEVDFRGAATCDFLLMSIGINLLQKCAAALWGEPFESRIIDGRINLGSVAASRRFINKLLYIASECILRIAVSRRHVFASGAGVCLGADQINVLAVPTRLDHAGYNVSAPRTSQEASEY